MAKKVVTLTTCDRCSKDYDEAPGEKEVDVQSTSADRQRVPIVYVEENGVSVVAFEDLCPKCKNRTEQLIKQLKLEKDDEAVENKGGVGDKTVEASSKDAKPPKKDKDKKNKNKGTTATVTDMADAANAG